MNLLFQSNCLSCLAHQLTRIGLYNKEIMYQIKISVTIISYYCKSDSYEMTMSIFVSFRFFFYASTHTHKHNIKGMRYTLMDSFYFIFGFYIFLCLCDFLFKKALIMVVNPIDWTKNSNRPNKKEYVKRSAIWLSVWTFIEII